MCGPFGWAGGPHSVVCLLEYSILNMYFTFHLASLSYLTLFQHSLNCYFILLQSKMIMALPWWWKKHQGNLEGLLLWQWACPPQQDIRTMTDLRYWLGQRLAWTLCWWSCKLESSLRVHPKSKEKYRGIEDDYQGANLMASIYELLKCLLGSTLRSNLPH